MLEQSLKGEACPRCGEKGSLQSKMVKNHQDKSYYYYYFAHYSGLIGKTSKVRRCYIGKRNLPTEVSYLNH